MVIDNVHEELREWRPDKRPPDQYVSWVGKLVTVRAWHAIMSSFPIDRDETGEPVWALEWVGWVVELSKWIPERELLKPMEFLK